MGRIILAEDDDLVAAVVLNVLTAAGHTVGRLADGASALNVIIQRPPDLAILDCNMPTMGGVEVLNEMRRAEHLYHIPVLMLTALSSVRDQRIAFFAGATDYLCKPFKPGELLRVAELLMAGPERRFG